MTNTVVAKTRLIRIATEYMSKVAASDDTPLADVTGRDVGLVGSTWATGAFVGGGRMMEPCCSSLALVIGGLVGSGEGSLVLIGDTVGFEVVGF